jgi:hypothetical protein
MITIAQILSEMWPGQGWVIDEDDYETLRWMDYNDQPKPTLEEIEAVRVQAEVSLEWKRIRRERDTILQNTDWTQLNNPPLTAEQVTAWATYRQELRDLPQIYDDPDFVIWPDKPE